MALSTLSVIAFRDLGRNRRRSILTMVAVALGLALLIALNGLTAGVLEDSLQNSIRLQTGHLQIRNASYQKEKLSLQWKDLLAEPEALAGRANTMPEVKAATPVLWAGGMLNAANESAGVQIYGIDPTSPVFAPIREALVAGQFLTPDDRAGILIGKRLADSLDIGVDQRVTLSLVDGDGRPQEGVFTIRGVFYTGVASYDESAAFMPLAKAQAFSGAGDRASAIVILLKQQNDADKVAAALRAPGNVTLTWRTLNALFLETMQSAMGFYVLFDLIVILVVAVVIANTLLMAVFERVREVGILAALGMKRRQVMLLFLLEAAILGLAGIVLGMAIGLAGVAYLARVGIYIGEDIAATAGNIAISTIMYARFVPGAFLSLAVGTLGVIVLAALYPAWFAARLEPVRALHAQ